MTARKKKINVKKILNKAFVLSVIVCLCISQSAIFIKADVVEFTEASKLGATMVDLYGQANNANLAYNNLTESGALAEVIQLYDTYCTGISDPVTLATIGAALAAAGTVAVIYDAITGQGYIQLFQETYINSLDGYWDYTCNDMGLSRNQETGNYEWTATDGEVIPIVLYSRHNATEVRYLSNPGGLDSAGWYGSGTAVCTYEMFQREYKGLTVCDKENTYVVFNQDNNRFYFLNTEGFTIYNNSVAQVTYANGNVDYYQQNSGTTNTSSVTINDTVYQQCTKPYGNFVGSGTLSSIDVPVYANEEEIYANIEELGIVKEVTCDNVEGTIITFPTTDVPEYHPSPFRYTTNIPFNPNWGNPLPDGVSEPEAGVAYPITDPAILNQVVPEIWHRVYVDTIQEQDVETNPETNPDPDPEQTGDITTTTIPLLPITLPNFNFSFSGIWHYVVDWVASLGSWFTAMFQMWNTLPYAMVLPVYATAVVVIVIGVYKRFFM